MAFLKIARMGHPVLRSRARPVEDLSDPEIRRLIRDMIETMDDAGGVGLAAPQVHEALRIVVVRLPRADGGPDTPPVPTGAVALVNPSIEPLDEEVVAGLEGCLSIPGLRGIVPRYRRILYRGLAPSGETVEGEADGLEARVLQHEVDHLDGVLYPDRMTDLRQLTFETELPFLLRGMEGAEQD